MNVTTLYEMILQGGVVQLKLCPVDHVQPNIVANEKGGGGS